MVRHKRLRENFWMKPTLGNLLYLAATPTAICLFAADLSVGSLNMVKIKCSLGS